MGKLVRARTGFIADVDGADITVKPGEVFDSSHALVKRTPEDWWDPLEVTGQVESATAAPGERRAARVKSAAKE